jgi:hypothetical protein
VVLATALAVIFTLARHGSYGLTTHVIAPRKLTRTETSA